MNALVIFYIEQQECTEKTSTLMAEFREFTVDFFGVIQV